MNSLTVDAYSVANLTVDEIFEGLELKVQDPLTVWNSLHHYYGEDFFMAIIE